MNSRSFDRSCVDEVDACTSFGASTDAGEVNAVAPLDVFSVGRSKATRGLMCFQTW